MKRAGSSGHAVVSRRKVNRSRALLLLVFGYAFFFILMTSPLFDLRQVEIKGNQQVSRQELLLRSGLAMRSNIFDQNLRGIARRIAVHPRVRSVRVRRRIPSTLVISMQERRPVAVIAAMNAFYQLDMEGYVIGTGKLQDLAVMPLVDLPVKSRPVVGRKVQAARIDETLYTLVAAYSYLTDMPRKIDIDKKGLLCLYIKDGKILLGSFDSREAMDNRLHLASVIAAREKARGRHCEYIDVRRYTNNPVVRYAD